jgi:hypothetical protein
VFVKYFKYFNYVHSLFLLHVSAAHGPSSVQGTNSTKTHTSEVNDTLKRNSETAAKKDRMKISYEAD